VEVAAAGVGVAATPETAIEVLAWVRLFRAISANNSARNAASTFRVQKKNAIAIIAAIA